MIVLTPWQLQASRWRARSQKEGAMVLPHPRCQCPAVTTTRRSHFWAWRSLSIKEHSDRYALLAMEPMMKRIQLAENGLVKQQCQDVVNNLKHIWNRQQHDLHNSILSFLFNIYIYILGYVTPAGEIQNPMLSSSPLREPNLPCDAGGNQL